MDLSARALLAAVLASPVPSWGSSVFSPENAPAVDGAAKDSYEDVLARELAARLGGDPEAVAALTGRILKSKVSELLTQAEDSRQATKDVADWIRQNPLDAAHLGVGFSRDDAEGTREFENALFERVKRHVEMSPGRYRGLYGKLHAMAKVSRGALLKEAEAAAAAADEPENSRPGGAPPPDEPLRDAVGKGPPSSEASFVLLSPERALAPPTLSRSDAFERLAALGAKAAPEQLLAIQNQLRRESPPWAPPLVESGVLDYRTLRHPAHALRAELDQVLAGGSAGSEAVSRAEAAIAGFEALAEAARGEADIEPGTLDRLARSRRQALRWLALARIEAELRGLSARAGFLDAELREAVVRAPAPERARRGFLDRLRTLSGELDERIGRLRAAARRLREETPGAVPLPAPAPELLREIELYRELPPRLLALEPPPGALRAWLEGWLLRLAPDSDWARRVRRRDDRRQAAVEEFLRLASATGG